MEPDISEFSYGFALTSELIERFKLKRAGAPEFATQHAESKKGGGWDMKLPGLPVFLQFKRAHEMVRATAAESGLLGIPYFRMHLRRKSHSDQHQLMLDLEGDGKMVLYAAPRFAKPIDLNKAFATKRVASRSIFVRPSAVGPLPDNKDHSIAYRVEPGPAYFCSRPVEIGDEQPATLFGEELPARVSSEPPRSSEQFFREVGEDLLRIYRLRHPSKEIDSGRVSELREQRGAQEIAGLLARTLYDCELLVYPKSMNDVQ